MRKITKSWLDSLPTIRLKYGPEGKHFYSVPYYNADEPVDVPLRRAHFKPNGKGLPWICGVSNAVNEARDLFAHPVFYVHTIGSATYIVVAVTKGGQPRLAIRHNHGATALIDAYDKARKNPKKYMPVFLAELEKHPVLHLRKGRSEAGKRNHDPKGTGAHTHRPQGLRGNARRMANAGFMPKELADQFERAA